MKVLSTALTELIGLFIEDGTLAVGILILLAVAAVAFGPIGVPPLWRGPLLLVLLLLLLVENIARSARNRP